MLLRQRVSRGKCKIVELRAASRWRASRGESEGKITASGACCPHHLRAQTHCCTHATTLQITQQTRNRVVLPRFEEEAVEQEAEEEEEFIQNRWHARGAIPNEVGPARRVF